MKKIFLTFLLFPALCMAKTGAEIIKENNFKPEVAPLLTTEWSQDGGENALVPTVGGKLAKTGCGATAVAQVMKFWEFPESGKGQNYYYWDNGAGELIARHADFSQSHYDWHNMIPRYKNNPEASETEIQAVATLMADLGVALEMKYTDDGTATNIEYISTVLKKHFGYNPYMTIHRFINGAYSWDEWLTLIYRELSEGRPVILGGTYNGSNHLFVADGYDATGLVHLNLGKASTGSSVNKDGYYDLTVTGKTYTQNQKMLIGVSPDEIPVATPEFNVATAGSLKAVLGGESESRKICRAKITGKLNADDIEWLRTLSAITTGQLSYIDLSDAVINNNTLPESAFDGSYTLQEIILPSGLKKIGTKAFRNCVGLWRVAMPHGLTEIGNYAFTYCRYLEDVSIPATVTKIGTNPFRYDKLTTLSLDDNANYTLSNNAIVDPAKTTLISMPIATTGIYNVEEGIVTIANQAFVRQTMISTLHIPESVVNIGSNAFMDAVALADIYVHTATPPTITADTFDPYVLPRCTVHVPKGSLSAYRNSKWNTFANLVDDTTTSVSTTDFIPEPDGIPTYFDMTGMKITNPMRNHLYIVRHADGTATKILYR